jgi:Phosphotransferase enzyme family
MNEDANSRATQIDPYEHPAVAAWIELQAESVRPTSVALLKKKEKSAAYRIEGVGQSGAAVIAKRCSSITAAIERSTYEEVLPHLPVSTLHFYGCVEEPGVELCWLFFEDAGERAYSPSIEEHRALAVQWLAVMHTSAVHVAAVARLPDRGPDNYLRHLRSGRAKIEEYLTALALNAYDARVLKSILSQCSLLESHWSEVEEFCCAMPRTLVHGDFAPKNVRVRIERRGMALLPFDWEMSGYGVPAADLTPVDPSAYRSLVHRSWPHLSSEEINQMAKLGRIFQGLATIDWLSDSLKRDAVQWFTAVMRNCETEMADAIQAAGWKD